MLRCLRSKHLTCLGHLLSRPPCSLSLSSSSVNSSDELLTWTTQHIYTHTAANASNPPRYHSYKGLADSRAAPDRAQLWLCLLFTFLPGAQPHHPIQAKLQDFARALHCLTPATAHPQRPRPQTSKPRCCAAAVVPPSQGEPRRPHSSTAHCSARRNPSLND